METTQKNTIDSNENVARLLSSDWVVNGKIQHTAFMLKQNETYISVNRPLIDTYHCDVATFVKNHKCYAFDNNIYKRALLNVGDVRGIDVSQDDVKMKIDVEVEPRDTHTKSHAGIFTRFQNKNIKKGQRLKVGLAEEGLSADSILLEVRKELLSLSILEEFKLPE